MYRKHMNKWAEILIGLILIIVPIIVVLQFDTFIPWGKAALEFIKGGVVIFVILIGLLFLMLGISDLKG